jgi:hypothetical protein
MWIEALVTGRVSLVLTLSQKTATPSPAQAISNYEFRHGPDGGHVFPNLNNDEGFADSAPARNTNYFGGWLPDPTVFEAEAMCARPAS